MESSKPKPATIDEYIAQYPKDIQNIMQKIRSTIKEAAPQATERISYGMPGFFQNGMLVWFGGRKDFIGFYPTGEGVEAFKSQLSSYTITKGAIHFPLDQPIPYELIKKITIYKVEQNKQKKGYGK